MPKGQRKLMFSTKNVEGTKAGFHLKDITEQRMNAAE